MRISDWSSDVCSSDLAKDAILGQRRETVVADRDDLVAHRIAGDMLLEFVPHGITLDIMIGDRDRIDARRHHPVDAVKHGIQFVQHARPPGRSEEHTSELQPLMRISYAVFCLKKKTHTCMPRV